MKAFLRGLLVLLLVLFVLGCLGTFVPRPLFDAGSRQPGGTTTRILVLSNPIHTDIAIPLTDETRAAYGFLGGAGIPVSNPSAEWLVIGWGGRAFYLETPTWADLKPMPVFRTLTVDRSVMHVDIAGPIDEGHSAVRAIDLAEADFRAMSDFILSSFLRGGQGEVMVIEGAGYGDYDRFFEAHGAFNALLGCNTWTAGALRAAGLRTGWWNPMPQTLGLSLDLLN